MSDKKKDNPKPKGQVCVEETPPPILIDTDGKVKVFNAKDFSNKFVVLILFHHAWDYQGTKEVEQFSEHVQKFKDQNCQLLGVSRDGPAVLTDWMKECAWNFPVVSDVNLAPKDFGIIQRLGLPLQHGYAVPSVVVIDKRGVVRTIASHSPCDGGCCVDEILRIVTALNQVVVPGDNGKLTPANWDAKQPYMVNTRKGVDDYYYRKYGLREEKYWSSKKRALTKSDQTKGTSEKKDEIKSNKIESTNENKEEGKSDKAKGTKEKNVEDKSDKVEATTDKKVEGKGDKVEGTNNKKEEGKGAKVGDTNNKKEVGKREGKSEGGGTKEKKEDGKSDKVEDTTEKKIESKENKVDGSNQKKEDGKENKVDDANQKKGEDKDGKVEGNKSEKDAKTGGNKGKEGEMEGEPGNEAKTEDKTSTQLVSVSQMFTEDYHESSVPESNKTMDNKKERGPRRGTESRVAMMMYDDDLMMM